MNIDADALGEWIGRSESVESEINAWPADAFSATLDRDDTRLVTGDAIPPGWHWLYFPEVVKLVDTGSDGHRRRGDFHPPVPLPRRMWAGTRMQFRRPLHVGETLHRESTIEDVQCKQGRSGPLVFVTTRHQVSGDGELAVVEHHEAVYRAEDVGGEKCMPNPAPASPQWQREVEPSPVLLFRFSALTSNSHRIHYDWRYATGIEGYPGLVVHGPLVALLLLDLFRREMPEENPRRFDFRAHAPLFDDRSFFVEGVLNQGSRCAQLWARNGDGAQCMSAEVDFGEGDE